MIWRLSHHQKMVWQPFSDSADRDGWAGEKVSYSRSFTMILPASEIGTAPKLGGRSYDRPPQTIRAFGLQELQPSPSLCRSERSCKTCRSFETLSPVPSIP